MRAEETSKKNTTIREVAQQIAIDVEKTLGNLNKAVRFGSFVPKIVQPKDGISPEDAARRSAHAAEYANPAELIELIRQELTARKITISPGPDAVMKIDGLYLEAESGTQQLIKIEIVLTELQPNIVREKSYNITNQPDVIRFLGLPVPIPPGASVKEQQKAIKDAVDAFTPVQFRTPHQHDRLPQACIDGTAIRSSKDSLFAIEIFTASPKPDPKKGHDDGDYHPLKPSDLGGLAFAKIDRGHVYAVQLINGSDYEVAVSLSIDGLSMFVACDPDFRDAQGQPNHHFVLVPKAENGKPSKVFVRGWFVNLNQSDEFKVTAYAESFAARFKSIGSVGVVNARFHASVKEGEKLPDGEPVDGGAYSQSADGTGGGARVPSPYVQVKRKIGLMRDNVAVRYSKD